MKAYPSYKTTNLNWINKIPNHWSSVNLRWVTQIYAGGTPSKDNLEYWENGTVPWIASGEVNQGYITKPTTYISEKGFNNSSAKWIPKDSLVMALAGQGKTKATVAQLDIPMTCNQSLAAIVPQKIGPRYLFYWLQSNYQNIRGLVGDGLRDGLNLDILGSLPALLPSETEQQAIADFLDRKTAQIDVLIAKKQRQIDLLHEQRTALINQAVTKGLNPNVPMKDSGVEWLGEIPSHWEAKQMRFCASIHYGISLALEKDANYDVKILTLRNINIDGSFNLSDIATISNEEVSSEDLFLKKGDLLFNWRNGSASHIGKTAYFDLDEEFTFVSFLLRLRVNDTIDARYLQTYLNALRSAGFFSTAKEQVNRTFNASELGRLFVLIPPMKEQLEISQYIETEIPKLENFIQKVQRQIDLLQEYRTALISAAVTGKIDVRGEGAVHE